MSKDILSDIESCYNSILRNDNYQAKLDIEDIKNEVIYLQQRIDKAIEYIKNGVDFKSLHFIAGQEEDLWKIILSDNVRKDLLEILGDEE